MRLGMFVPTPMQRLYFLKLNRVVRVNVAVDEQAGFCLDEIDTRLGEESPMLLWDRVD